jgi:hypothetical protein
LMERFEEYRGIVKTGFLEDLLEKIMIENGFKDIKPKIRYIKPKVDKTYVRDIILALYDRGLLSKETTLEEAGYNSEEQCDIRSEEKKKIDDILLRPEVPFAAPLPGKGTPKVPGTPNPQMKQNTVTKKENKVTEINKQKKKVTPRLEGSEKEQIYNMVEFIVDHSNTVGEAKKTISNLSSNLYNKNFGVANINLIDQEKFDNLISEILEIKTRKRDEFKRLVLINIESIM